jgi:hypothetical protein
VPKKKTGDKEALPAYRSRGIYADALTLMIRETWTSGAATALIAVDPGNQVGVK